MAVYIPAPDDPIISYDNFEERGHQDNFFEDWSSGEWDFDNKWAQGSPWSNGAEWAINIGQGLEIANNDEMQSYIGKQNPALDGWTPFQVDEQGRGVIELRETPPGQGIQAWHSPRFNNETLLIENHGWTEIPTIEQLTQAANDLYTFISPVTGEEEFIYANARNYGRNYEFFLPGDDQPHYAEDQTYDIFNNKGNGVVYIGRESTIVNDGSIRDGYRLLTQPYQSGMATLHGEFPITSGRIEVRGEGAIGPGAFPALGWLWHFIPHGEWPSANGDQREEIDIHEALGHKPYEMHQTMHWSTDSGGTPSIGYDRVLSPGMHTFGVDWTPDYIGFFYDGFYFFVVSGPEVQEFKKQAMAFMTNLAMDSGWSSFNAQAARFQGKSMPPREFPMRNIMEFIEIRAGKWLNDPSYTSADYGEQGDTRTGGTTDPRVDQNTDTSTPNNTNMVTGIFQPVIAFENGVISWTLQEAAKNINIHSEADGYIETISSSFNRYTPATDGEYYIVMTTETTPDDWQKSNSVIVTGITPGSDPVVDTEPEPEPPVIQTPGILTGVKPWDSLVVGGDILADSYFGSGFDGDFSQQLDGGANTDGILGTLRGWDEHPYDFNYGTDGQFKMGNYHQAHQLYATSFHYHNAADQRNREEQHYVHPHGIAGSNAVNPDPLAMFERRNGHLVLKARPSTREEQEKWCRIKGFSQDERGSATEFGWWNHPDRQNEEFKSLPLIWSPATTLGDDGEDVYFGQMYAPWVSSMMSTSNRCSMSFGRSMSRVRVPLGARLRGDVEDRRNIDCWFPAVWDLEDVPASCDLNGRLHDRDTHTPGNVGAGGVLTEFDLYEHFGIDRTPRATTHYYVDGVDTIEQDLGNGIIYRRNAIQKEKHFEGVLASLIPQWVKGQFYTVGLDRFPPRGDQPGKMVYHVDYKVIAIFDMPDSVGQPKIVYQPLHENYPYLPTVGADGKVIRLGSQLYENGQPAYPHYFQIWNIAVNAGFTRQAAYFDFRRDTDPHINNFGDENGEMEIEYTQMRPLIDENPDSRPFINYRAGEFGGSHPTDMGPVITGPGSGFAEGSGFIVPGGTVTNTSTNNIPTAVDGAINARKWVAKKTRPNGGTIYFPESC